MPRALFAMFLLLALTTAGEFASTSPKPPTREQMFYARREVELEAQIAKIKLKYTDSNPRVVTVQTEIDFCKQHTTLVALSRARRGMDPTIKTLEQELAQKEEDLRELQLRYMPSNPQVKAAQQSINDTLQEIALRKQK